MAIRIIAEGAKDTAHAIYGAHEIRKTKPDAVFLELPVSPFQEIFNDYVSGKIGDNALKKRLFKAVGKAEKKVDHDLADKFIAGELEAEELEAIESEGRDVHVLKAAKKSRAKLFAIDMPLDEIEKELLEEAEREHITNTKEIFKTNKLPNLIWELNEIIHYPFYVFERLIRHHGIVTMNPYRHNVNDCQHCMSGALYDRALSNALYGILNILPLSGRTKNEIKVAYLLRKIDFIREKYMASVILEKYRELKQHLHREPKILVIVHLWNAASLKWILKDLE